MPTDYTLSRLPTHRHLLRAFVSNIVVTILCFMALIASIASSKADESAALFFVREYEARVVQKATPMRRVAHERGVTRAPLASLLAASAARNGVPYRVAAAVMTVESRGRCHATSPSGARGAMQVLPATARSVGVAGNLHDCAVGIEAGMRYLALVIARHRLGCGALSTYERGIYATPRCTAYGRKVVRLASRGE